MILRRTAGDREAVRQARTSRLLVSLGVVLLLVGVVGHVCGWSA